MTRSVLVSKDSHFSKALRRKQAGGKKLGAGVFKLFSKKFGLERKKKRGVAGSKISLFPPPNVIKLICRQWGK